MTKRYVVDGLAIETNDAEDMLILYHPAVPGGPIRMTFQRARIYHEPATGNVSLELSSRGCEIRFAIEGLTAPSVLVAVRDALVDLRMMGSAEVVGRYYSHLARPMRGERGMTVEGCSSRILTSDIEGLMEAVDMARSEIVPCLMGASGIGKTEGIESFARKHGRQVVHLIASQILPTEVSGMTMPNQDTHSMDVFDHSRISHMRDGDILFLDELLKGQQQVLSACLTMVQERRLMSGTPLPDVIIVAAANPLASPKMLPLEIRQRFLFVSVEFDEDSWCEYMRERGIPRPEAIVYSLVTRHEGDDWNTLTPRTATKLLDWLRDVSGTESEQTVRSVIRTTFDESVLESMTRALLADETVETRSPIEQVAEMTYSLVEGLPHTDDPEERLRREELLSSLSEASSEKTIDNVGDLLERIGKLSGGSEILRTLGEEEISMPGFGEY